MGKGTVTSEEHVDVKLTNGTLSSDRLRVTGGGEVVVFEGNVVMHLDHFDAADPSAQPAGPVEPAPPTKASRSNKSANSK
jgi:lipopolysaccharide export system protein LptC